MRCTRRRGAVGMEQPAPNQAQEQLVPNQTQRIEALEHALGTEVARFRQHHISTLRPLPAHSGELTESVEDFFTDIERYAINNQIPEAQMRNYLPDFLSGTAREFFRTLGDQQVDTFEHLRTAFTNQFNSQACTQAALQQFYCAEQQRVSRAVRITVD